MGLERLADQAIDETIPKPDADVQKAMKEIERKFNIISSVRAFEASGYSREFEVKQLMKIARSRKATPETRRKALESLRQIRESLTGGLLPEGGPPPGPTPNKREEKARQKRAEIHGKEWVQEADSFG
jgi:hypothetical protein